MGIKDQELGSWMQKQEVARIGPWGGLTPDNPGVCSSEARKGPHVEVGRGVWRIATVRKAY